MKREGINYPKFKDQFALMDFEAEPLPALSLFLVPAATRLEEWEITLTGLAGERRCLVGPELEALPRVRERSTLVCQIFNWSEELEVEGVRLVDVLDFAGIDAPEDGFFAFHSADGLYFEGLPHAIARDPRTLLVFGLAASRCRSGTLVGTLLARLQEREVAALGPGLPQRPGRHQEAIGPKPYRDFRSRWSGGGRRGSCEARQRGLGPRNPAPPLLVREQLPKPVLVS